MPGMNPGLIVTIIFWAIAIIFIIMTSITANREKLLTPENLENIIKFDAQFYNNEEMNPFDYFNVNIIKNRDDEIIEMNERPKHVGAGASDPKKINSDIINENKEQVQISIQSVHENEKPAEVGAGGNKNMEQKDGDAEVEDINLNSSINNYNNTQYDKKKGLNNKGERVSLF